MSSVSGWSAEVTSANLRPHVQEVVNYLHIHRDVRYNSSACRMIKGCEALGYNYLNLPKNTRKCRECGSCGTGCPYDRKQSGFVTWLQPAFGPRVEYRYQKIGEVWVPQHIKLGRACTL